MFRTFNPAVLKEAVPVRNSPHNFVITPVAAPVQNKELNIDQLEVYRRNSPTVQLLRIQSTQLHSSGGIGDKFSANIHRGHQVHIEHIYNAR